MGVLFFNKRNAGRLAKWSQFFSDIATRKKNPRPLPHEVGVTDSGGHPITPYKGARDEWGQAEWDVYKRDQFEGLMKEPFKVQYRGRFTKENKRTIDAHKQAVIAGSFRFDISEKIERRRRERHIEKAAENFAQQLEQVARGPNKRVRLQALIKANEHWLRLKSSADQSLNKTFDMFNSALIKAVSRMPFYSAQRIHLCFRSFMPTPPATPDNSPSRSVRHSPTSCARGFGLFGGHLADIFTKRTRRSSLLAGCMSSRDRYFGADIQTEDLTDDIETLVDELCHAKNRDEMIAVVAPFSREYFSLLFSNNADEAEKARYKERGENFKNKFFKALQDVSFKQRVGASLSKLFHVAHRFSKDPPVVEDEALAFFDLIVGELYTRNGKNPNEYWREQLQLFRYQADSNARYDMLDKKFFLSQLSPAEIKILVGDGDSEGVIHAKLKNCCLSELLEYYQPFLDKWNQYEKQGKVRKQPFEPHDDSLFMQVYQQVKQYFYPLLAQDLLNEVIERLPADPLFVEPSNDKIDALFQLLFNAYGLVKQNRMFQQQGDIIASLREALNGLLVKYPQSQLEAFCHDLNNSSILEAIGTSDWMDRKASMNPKFRQQLSLSHTEVSDYNKAVMGVFDALRYQACEVCNNQFATDLTPRPIPYRNVNSPVGTPEQQAAIQRVRASTDASTRSGGSLTRGGSTGSRGSSRKGGSNETPDGDDVGEGDQNNDSTLRRRLWPDDGAGSAPAPRPPSPS